ncbi:MAG: 2-keto-4-pentenoate hydratase [Ardenticatenaceae bacterium]
MWTRLVDLALDAKDNQRIIEPPSRGEVGFGLDEAYQVYAALDRRLRGRGYEAVGRKIGFTNPVLWEEFRIDRPIWAYVYDQTCQFADTGEVEVALDTMVTPRIEPELVLKVNDRILSVGNEPEALIEAVDWIAIGFELVECHYPNWVCTAADTLADFVLHGKLIIGKRLQLDTASMGQICKQLETFAVELRRNGELIATGLGSHTLGSPLKALSYLRQVLDSQSWAEPLQPNELITTGSLTSVPYIKPGEEWSVDVSGLALQPLVMRTK